MKKKWYAVYTKPKNERKVSALLTKKKIENYCPLKRVTGDDSVDRKKYTLEPLFPSFVFVYITDLEFSSVKQVNDVINFVYWKGEPAVISQIEIESMEQFINEYYNVYTEKTEVSKNNLVRIVSRIPSIEEGNNVIPLRNSLIKITLPSLGYMICAESVNAYVEKAENNLIVKNLVS